MCLEFLQIDIKTLCFAYIKEKDKDEYTPPIWGLFLNYSIKIMN